MTGLNQMRKLIKISMAVLFSLLFSTQCYANDIKQYLPSLNNYIFADAEGCRSCIDAAGCERVLRECQAECNSTSFYKDGEHLACGTTCTVSWSACTTKAKSECTYYCKEDS